MATIKDAVLIPEEGWRRYDNKHPLITYEGTWGSFNTGSESWFGGEATRSSALDSKCKFIFYGSKLRILGAVNATDCSTNIQILIDGTAYDYSTYNSATVKCALVFEKLDLDIGFHTIEIVNKVSGSYNYIDAIDVDSNGYLTTYIESKLSKTTNLQDMKIGDIISCRYTAPTSGKVGYFSELGTCDTNFIASQVSSATPDGKFYFVKVSDDKLIADRNIQHSITWNELNNNNLIDGKTFETKIAPLVPMTSNETDDVKINVSSFLAGNDAWSAFNCTLNPIGASTYDCWCGVGNDAYYEIVFKKNKVPVDMFKIYQRKHDALYPFKTVAIKASNDGVIYDEILKQTTVSNLQVNGENIFTLDSRKAYSIYRFEFTGTTYITVGEIEFWLKENNASITLPTGGVAYSEMGEEVFPVNALTSDEGADYKLTASSCLGSTVMCYKAFNKSNVDSNDCWHSGAETKPWLKVDFKESPKVINGFKLTNRNDSGTPQAPVSCEVLVSNDDIAYTSLFTTTTSTVYSSITSYTFNNTSSYRYYKFQFTSPSSRYTAIGDLELYDTLNYNNTKAFSYTNKNQGGWPINNDWDKYIWKSNLDGKVTSSDDGIWNYSKLTNLVKERSLTNTLNIDGSSVAKVKCSTRGFCDSLINDSSAKRFALTDTTYVSTGIGFRPMLILKEGI